MSHSDQILKNQTAIVTGGSSGIGKAISIAFGAAGANVVVNYFKHEGEARETQKAIEDAGGKAIMVQGDVGIEADVLNIFDEAQKSFGKVNILVNNAGIQIDKELTKMSLEDWNQVIQTNLTGSFICAREAAKCFEKQGIDDKISKASGKIIFIGSVHDTIPWAGRVNYTSSKGGMKMMMKSIAAELAPKQVRVNSISPGAIKTSINEEERTDEDGKEEMLDKIPYGRIGDPDDIGKVAVWLASDQADYITGTTIYVDGGMTLYASFQEE